MNKCLISILLILLSLNVSAQNNERKNEAGIVFNGFDNFGLTYRIGTDKSLWRFNTLIIGTFKSTNSETFYPADKSEFKSTNLSAKIGKEYRNNLSDKLEFRYGLDLSFGYNYNESDINYSSILYREIYTYKLGGNIVLGLNYCITKNLILGVELLPEFNYINGETTIKEKTYLPNGYESHKEYSKNITGHSFDFSSKSALLSLVYRF